MAEPTTQTIVGPLTKFYGFVKDKERQGCHASGEAAVYVSRVDSEEYWQHGNIVDAFCANGAGDSMPFIEDIQNESLQLLSTLFYDENLSHLAVNFLSEDLTDDKLPLAMPHPGWSSGPIIDKLFESIVKHQWRFFALYFDSHHLHNRHLDPRHILPIRNRELLAQSEDSKVYRIEIDDDYNKLVDKGSHGRPVQNEFALKICLDDTLFENEVKAYGNLQNMDKSDNIIRYYGSFSQDKLHCLILELATGGTLDQLLQDMPPNTPTERLQFWKSFFGYFKGLHRVHQASDMKGLHGDIKPDNLLRRQEPSGSKYQFTAKLADFGYSDFRKAAPGIVNALHDRHGNQQYSAPEASHPTEFSQSGPNHISDKADTFSMGAVASEAIVWVAFGQQGLARYRKLRKDVTNQHSHLQGSGYAGCFHDGVNPLSATFDKHEEALKALPACDKITPRVIQLVKDAMLRGQDSERWAALRIVNKFDIDYESAEREMTNWPDSPEPSPHASDATPGDREATCSAHRQTASTSTSSSSATNSSRPLSRDTVASVETLDGISDGRGRSICDHINPSAEVARPGPCPLSHPVTSSQSRRPSSFGQFFEKFTSSLSTRTNSGTSALSLQIPGTNYNTSGRASPVSPGVRLYLTLDQLRSYCTGCKAGFEVDPVVMGLVQQLKTSIRKREHIFLVDDSLTMGEKKLEAVDAFKTLSRVAKEVDTNGIELLFASDPNYAISSKRSKKLSRRVEGQAFNMSFGMMKEKMDIFLNTYIRNRLSDSEKPLSILVLTDGRWGSRSLDDTAAGVVTPVDDFIHWLSRKGITRSRITISFIHFGNDQLGIHNLNVLDKYGRINTFPTGGGVMKPFDMIDSVSISGNVFKFFVGGMSDEYDDD